MDNNLMDWLIDAGYIMYIVSRGNIAAGRRIGDKSQ